MELTIQKIMNCVRWSQQKPKKPGIYLHRVKDRDGVGVMAFDGTNVHEISYLGNADGATSHRIFPLDTWWSVCPDKTLVAFATAACTCPHERHAYIGCTTESCECNWMGHP